MANLHLVTGYAGEAHITSADHGSLNAAIFGEENCVLNRGSNLSASAIASNTVRVLDGDLLLQGRHVRLEGYVDLTITSGTQGRKRHDLIVARYTKNSTTGVEECNLVVIKGTASTSPADPAYTEGDILDGTAVQTNFPLYRVVLNGVNLESVTPLFDTVEIIKVPVDGIIPAKHLPGLSSSVTSASTTTPANSYAVKLAYDKAKAAEVVFASKSVPFTEDEIYFVSDSVTAQKLGRLVICDVAFHATASLDGSTQEITLSSLYARGSITSDITASVWVESGEASCGSFEWTSSTTGVLKLTLNMEASEKGTARFMYIAAE